MIDSVRSALSSAIRNSAPPIPEFPDTESRLKYLRWLGAMSDRLYKKQPDAQHRIEFLQTVWYESKRAGLDVAMVLGLITVESNFRKYAVSSAGARGFVLKSALPEILIQAVSSLLNHKPYFCPGITDAAPADAGS